VPSANSKLFRWPGGGTGGCVPSSNNAPLALPGGGTGGCVPSSMTTDVSDGTWR
jgi:hypothetical protein